MILELVHIMVIETSASFEASHDHASGRAGHTETHYLRPKTMTLVHTTKLVASRLSSDE